MSRNYEMFTEFGNDAVDFPARLGYTVYVG
jgi:hypothetical protein